MQTTGTLKPYIRKHLGSGTDQDIMKLLTQAPIISERTLERLSIYSIYQRIVEIDGLLLQYKIPSTVSSIDLDKIGVDFDLACVVEVTRAERMFTIYEEVRTEDDILKKKLIVWMKDHLSENAITQVADFNIPSSVEVKVNRMLLFTVAVYQSGLIDDTNGALTDPTHPVYSAVEQVANWYDRGRNGV